MTTPGADSGALVDDAGTPASQPTAPPLHPTEPSIPTKSKKQNIRVSPAVLDAARRVGEQLLGDLRTSLSGLTEADAEEQARISSELWHRPNE